MSRWALEWICRSVVCFLVIAPIFFLGSNTWVGMSSPAVSFSKDVCLSCQFAVEVDCGASLCVI
jgi:hypothetical protein